MHKRKSAFFAATLIGMTAFSGVVTSGCSNQRFPNMLSKSDEVKLGQDAAKQIDRENKIITSGPAYDKLQRVAARIIPQADRDYDVDYTVKLIDSKEINAFALPGGPIYFYTGLVDLTQTDDELASVLGHEAAHVVKRHSAKQISDSQAKSVVAQILLGRQSNAVQQIASLGLNVYQLKFSRGDESESDEVGFRYLVQAGYNPDAMANFFRRMGEKTGKGNKSQEWLQSHPVTTSRVEKAEQRAAEYKKNHP
jgi:predicted Zn-dependent protease